MKKIKISNLSIAFFIFLVLNFVIPFSSALGLSPAEKTIAYEPDKDVNFEFFIINSEANNFNVSLSASGELSEFVFFDTTLIEVNASKYRTSFGVALKIPEGLSPGLHVVYIKATPVIATGQSSFSAFVSPQVPIYVRVPYPDKYAQVRLQIVPVGEGMPIPVSLQFDNLGNEDIESAGGNILFFDGSGESIASLSLPSVRINANSFAKTEGQKLLSLSSGVYFATADAFYDGESVKINQSFQIGEPSVEISSFPSKSFKSGEVNRVSFDASLFWNRPLIANVFVGVNGNFQELPSVNLLPNDESTINGFFDATDVSVGEQELIIRFVFGSQIKDYKYLVKFYPEGSVIASGKSISVWLSIVILVLSVLLFGGLVFLLLKLRKNKEKFSNSNSMSKGKSEQSESNIFDNKDLSKINSNYESDDKYKNETDVNSEDNSDEDDNYTPDMDHPLGFNKDELKERSPK